MRHLISGVVAAVAVMAAAPAMACGYNPCGTPYGYGYSYGTYVQPRYVAPVASFDYGYNYGYGCGTCGGYVTARLAEPTTQYYYVNQGPTYTGPGVWAPQPRYYEPSVSGWSSYARPYGYVARPRYYGPRAYGYGYAHRYHGHYYGRPILRRYN